MEMLPKERVQAAFEHRPTDRVPVHHIGFCSEVASALLGREAYVGGGVQQWREACALWKGPDAHAEFLDRTFRDAVDINLLCENDIVRPNFWRYDTKPTRRIDENTFLYEYGDEADWRVLRHDSQSEQCHVFDYRPRSDQTFDDIEAELAAKEDAVADLQPCEESYAFELRAQELLGHERAVRIGGVGVGMLVTGDPIWIQAIALRPDLVARYLDLQVERARRTVPFLVARGFRYLFGGGDFAADTGPIYSPRAFHELMLPRLREVSDICHQHGAYHLFASDGDLWPVADDLFGASGVDGFYEIDRRAGMDLARLRERFPRLTLIGNISSHTAHLGTADELVGEAVSAIEEAKRSHGIIVGISNYFVPGTPIDHVVAVLEAIKALR